MIRVSAMVNVRDEDVASVLKAAQALLPTWVIDIACVHPEQYFACENKNRCASTEGCLEVLEALEEELK